MSAAYRVRMRTVAGGSTALAEVERVAEIPRAIRESPPIELRTTVVEREARATS